MSKAMVIDDSRVIRMILTNTLKDLGYEVCQAANGKEAMASPELKSDTLSLILLDWNMPEMNGIEFLEQLRLNKSFASVPVIMVTTETEMGQMVRALESGANDYMMKPFTKEMVADKLHVMGLLQ